MMRAVCFALILCCAWATLPAGGAETPSAKRLRVLTSFYPVYSIAANIAGYHGSPGTARTGDLAEVHLLLSGEVDPHEYQFSRRDLEKLKRSDLLLLNGLGLENWMNRLLSNAGATVKVVSIFSNLDPFLIQERVGNSHNPHVWLDPLLVLHGITNVLEAMQAADPLHADAYAANATAYIQTLTKLHAEMSALLAPLAGKPMVTFHDAFPYLARRYGLKVVGVVQPVSDVAPSGRYLSVLRQSILQHGVRVIFTESGHSDRLPRQLARDLKIAIAPLDTLETGTMDPAGYVQRMRQNAEVIAAHLKAHASTR